MRIQAMKQFILSSLLLHAALLVVAQALLSSSRTIVSSARSSPSIPLLLLDATPTTSKTSMQKYRNPFSKNTGRSHAITATTDSDTNQGGTQDSLTLRLIGNTQPEYPVLSRRRGEEGTFHADLLIGPGGVVQEIVVLASTQFAQLDRAAIQFLKKALFESDHPIYSPVHKSMTVRFELSRN